MAIRVALHHTTRYVYDRAVELSPHVIRLRPAPHCRTPIEAYSLKITPAEHFINWQQDPFGNYLARIVFLKPSSELKVEVDLIADLVTINPFNFFLEEYAEHYPFTYEPALLHELQPYLEKTKTGPLFEKLFARILDDVARPGKRYVDVLVGLNQLVQKTIRYDIRMEPGVFTPEETLERGHGSCRDFAWLVVHLGRRLGLAARFVSGYSIQLRPDQKPLEGPAGVTEDCTDLHAWAEVYLPGAGWIGLDATSGLMCGEGHIPLACTADPTTAAPVTGSVSFAKKDEDDELGERFGFEMRVTRIEDRPRPTKSYTDEQWRDIVACGDAVERALVTSDVRLTMGGEPTFVSVDDIEGDEWNTEALGPTKAALGDAMLRKLMKRFAPGGFLHHGQGKWYPGESLPRWAYSCYWRKDGEPIWKNPALIANLKGASPRGASVKEGGAPIESATSEDARVFVNNLLTRLGVTTDHVLPGYEDTWYHLWRERKLPVNVDPFDAKLENEEERARLRKVFSQGLAHVVGYAVPLRAEPEANGRARWTSAAWFLRDERLYLVPGDSPMGFRLPLDSLPWASKEDTKPVLERDPFAPVDPLPTRLVLAEQRPHARETARSGGGIEAVPAIARGVSAKEVIRTAVCVEARGGVMHVFLPPVEALEHYLELVAKIEETAAALAIPVRIEGYLPPSDPRMDRIQVTPDPGVLEVNVHPAGSWKEVVATTTAVYEEARETRLGTDKFMLDGRHTGTGGGNHLVVGGATPADSPFLRRPDLVRSLIAYFVNHPSLSYLFSGRFIGPTSQAPRIDEARQDSLYELETAFDAIPPRPPADAPISKGSGSNGDAPPWLVDRLFRHLLTDVTGNTHRSEICIDKLYNPDSASGRQGLVELRAFEMPPDAKMSCAQQLLMRALIAWFWREPYGRRLVRWGTALHDKFMLPHFVQEDIVDVVAELRRAGFPVRSEWFTPHWEFRFPQYGRVTAAGIDLELRQALEPWHVLGEEQGAGGTARYVDSSVERVQLLARGLVDTRHMITCNGRELPMHPTGRAGEYVAGVRFKAWKPPSSLHPTLPTNVPLVFDVVDTWAERAVGGCTYNVSHPGGLSYQGYPANGLEAEGRRLSRFEPFGHTPGILHVGKPSRSLELPHTLDLRRARP